jgi:hypothetical protein
VALNDTYFFTAQGTLGGRNYVHTLHFRELIPSVGINPAQDLIDKWQTACQAAWLGIHPSPYNLVRLTAQRICGSPPLPSRVEEGVGLPGTRASSAQALPPWLSIAVNLSTGLAGKSRHGRFFVSGGAEDDVDGENLASGSTAWATRTTTYITALGTRFAPVVPPTDWQLVVHSRKLADVPGTQCNVSSEPVTGIGMVGRLTSQRSRRA